MPFIPTLTPAPSSPCGPPVTLVGDTLSRTLKWIQTGCKRTTWSDGAPWKSRYENKLTAWRIDRGIAKTKLPTLLSGNIQVFETHRETTWWC